jgi:hypothetical protein
MPRKPTLLVAVILVISMVLPNVAQAAEATLPAGTRAPVGTELTWTGKNLVWQSATWGTFTCAALNLNSRLTKNNGFSVESSGETAIPTQTGCNNGAERPLTITRFVLTDLNANGLGTGTKSVTMSFTMVWDFPPGVVCNFTGTNVTGTYVSGTNVLKFVNATGITSTGGCSTLKFGGEFALEKAGASTALILD